MLRIIEGSFYSKADETVKAEITSLTEAGKRVFLIVPEQQALIAEVEMASLLPPSAALTFEVTNFTRLANTVARALGGIAEEYADSGKESLIMWMTLTELAPFLKMTGNRPQISAGLVEKALSAVNEMKSLSQTPEALDEISESDALKNNRRLLDKLSDISKIMSLYNRLLTERYTSVRDECERLAEKLKAHPDFFAHSHFFICGFTSFTEPQYKVLCELMRDSEVTVHLCLSDKRERGFEFLEIDSTEARLVRTANIASVKTTLIKQHEPTADADTKLAEVCSSLWKIQNDSDNKGLQISDDRLRVFEAADPYEECDFIASDIKRRVMAGAAYRDFAIIARDDKRYSGILDASLESTGVPHFTSSKKNISSYEAIKLIYTAFAVYESSFARDDVIAYAKCRLCGASAEACDEFELYTEKWQIEGAGFSEGVFWNMNPDGYSARKRKEHDATLLKINETRELIISPLVKFSDALSCAKTVREHARALVDFLLDMSLPEKLGVRAEELEAYGEHDAATENGKLWEIICTSLDSVVEVLGDAKCNSTAFLEQLKVIISNADIGKIPAFYDEVTVGSADMLRLFDKKHVYLIGVNAGEFPAPASQSSYFTEHDCTVLKEAGLESNINVETLYARELFFFSRAFASAKESVTILYSLRNSDLTPAAKAEVITNIGIMTGGTVAPTKISNIAPIDRIYSPAAAVDVIDMPSVSAALKDSGFMHEITVSSGNIEAVDGSLQKDTVDLMYPSDMALTQSRIDAYVSCPFAYYLRYSLNLSENGKAEFDARNIGTFIHAILENFFDEVLHGGVKIGEIDEAARTEMVTRAAKKYLDEISKDNSKSQKRTEILLDRLSRAAMPVVDGLCDEMKNCGFVPRYFELKIGREDESLPSPATFKDKDGNNIFVYGSIDRVDTFKLGDDVYVRVIDYKTGSKTFSPSDLDEGKNLQMFLYLKAIVETENEKFKENIGVTGSGRIIPSGVIYVKTDMSDVVIPHADEDAAKAAIKKNQERRGMLLDDPVSLDAMNKDFIPIKFKKDGTPDARSEKYLYSYGGWEKLDEKISQKVCEVAEKMKSGDISTTNQKHNPPCDFCRFKPICRKKSNG